MIKKIATTTILLSYAAFVFLSPLQVVRAQIQQRDADVESTALNPLNPNLSTLNAGVTTNAIPTGSIDTIGPTGYVQGRAFDKNSTKLKINFYLDAPSGAVAWLGSAYTGLYSNLKLTDSAGTVGGRFYYQIPIERLEDGQAHKLYAYIVDIVPGGGTGTNSQIGNKTYDIPVVPRPSVPSFAVNNTMIAIPTLNSITILVNTSISSNVTIDYGPTNAYGKSVTSNNQTIHKILVPNLSSATTYHYRVTARQTNDSAKVIVKPDSTFKTQAPAGKTFTFAAIGDMQRQNWSVVASNIKAFNPDLLLAVGDNSDNYVLNKINRFDYYLAQWQKDVFNYSQNLTDHIASYFILGNHDYVSDLNVAGSSHLPGPTHQYFSQILAYPQSSQNSETNYSFDYGDAHFATLDTFDACPSDAQISWLDQDLQQTNKSWKIILLHIPSINPGMMSTTTRSSGNCLASHPDRANRLAGIFKTRGVDMAINGHSHTYSRWVKDNTYYVTNSTSGNYDGWNAPTGITNIFDLPGGAAGTLSPPKSIGGSGYLTGTVSPTQITINVYRATELSTTNSAGQLTSFVTPHYSIIDTFTLKKNSPFTSDLNKDGHVNLFDYNLLVAGFGTTYTVSDFNTLKAQYEK